MRTILAAPLALLLVSASASAQTKAFVLLSTACQLISCDPTYLLEVDIESRRILGLTHIANGPYPADRSGLTGDGRYLVWAGEKDALSPTFLSLFDNVAHTTVASVLLEPEPVPRLIVHPSESRVFLLQGANVVVIEPDRQQTFPAVCPTRPPDWLGLSGDGARLFAFCMTDVFPLQRGETRVLDSETGALIATVANTSGPLATNAAGTELYAVDYTGGYPGILKRYDIATGAVLAQRAFQAGRNPDPSRYIRAAGASTLRP